MNSYQKLAREIANKLDERGITLSLQGSAYWTDQQGIAILAHILQETIPHYDLAEILKFLTENKDTLKLIVNDFEIRSSEI